MGRDQSVKKLLRALRRDRKGATAIEYGLIAALVVIAIIASLKGLASVTVGMWNDVDEKVEVATD